MMLWPAALLLASAQAAASSSTRLEQMGRRLQDAPQCTECGAGFAEFVAGFQRLNRIEPDPFAAGDLAVARQSLVCAHAGDLRCAVDRGCVPEDDISHFLEGSGCLCDACPGAVAIRAHLEALSNLELLVEFGTGNVTAPTEEEVLGMQCSLVDHLRCTAAAPACRGPQGQGYMSDHPHFPDLTELEGRCGPGPTCGEVRDQYKEQGCCGAPNKEFHFHAPRSMRRLQADDGAGAAAERVRAALRRAKAKGGTTEARALARRIGRVLDSYAE